jgi:hypothetical protein
MKMSELKAWIFGYNLKDGITNLAAALFASGSIVVVCTTNNVMPKEWEKYGQSAIGASGVLGLVVSGKRGDLQGGQIDAEPPTPKI